VLPLLLARAESRNFEKGRGGSKKIAPIIHTQTTPTLGGNNGRMILVNKKYYYS